MPVILALIGSATAAEVVWLAPPTDEQAQRVATAAGAARGPLTLIDLRAAATDWTEADSKAQEALVGTLKDVRKYETQLDGELLIIDELAGPIGRIGLLRDEAGRSALFSALAYQGFAVDRFFANQLGKDPRAEAYRSEYEGLFVARPWVDAVALDADREVTAYDIAEAKQRVNYGNVMAIAKRQLPARLVPVDVPAGAELFADGRPLVVGPSGSANLVPGRHLLHATLDGHVIARWDVRLEPAQKADAVVPLSDSVFTAFVEGLATGKAPPSALVPSLHALGDAVWIADPRGTLQVWKVDKDSVTAVELPKVKATGAKDEDDGGLSLAGGVGSGWLSTGDFLLQNPDPALATTATVNAVAVTFGGGADLDVGPARFGAGVDVAMTLGENHVAVYGDSRTRLRTYPYVAGGIDVAQVTLGYAFPHHPTAGLRATVPLGPVELRVLGWYGLGLDREREGGEAFHGTALYAISAGVGGRFSL